MRKELIPQQHELKMVSLESLVLEAHLRNRPVISS